MKQSGPRAKLEIKDPVDWIIPEKIHTFPREEINNTPLSLSGHFLDNSPPPSSDGKNFLCGWGMDLFWNDPLANDMMKLTKLVVNIACLHLCTTLFQQRQSNYGQYFFVLLRAIIYTLNILPYCKLSGTAMCKLYQFFFNSIHHVTFS